LGLPAAPPSSFAFVTPSEDAPSALANDHPLVDTAFQQGLLPQAPPPGMAALAISGEPPVSP
jgi:hypothetical protein